MLISEVFVVSLLYLSCNNNARKDQIQLSGRQNSGLLPIKPANLGKGDGWEKELSKILGCPRQNNQGTLLSPLGL